jgi:hypothetical protein
MYVQFVLTFMEIIIIIRSQMVNMEGLKDVVVYFF